MLVTMGTYQCRLSELPDQIHQQSIKFLHEIIGFKAAEEFRRLHKNGGCWMPERVSNELVKLFEENICDDDNLLSQNWRDYIVPLVEEAMGF
jgi:hypothetical protein